MLGRRSPAGCVLVRKGERPPIGDAGGVALSFSKFSNLERREETGLIDDVSLP